MAFIRKIKGSLVQMDRTEYIGEETYLFYDIETGCIYRYNGLPGGELIAGCGAGGSGDDNVDAYPTLAAFPATGAADVIYIAEDTNLIYRWNGTNYVLLSASSVGADNVDTYANVAAFPPVGTADVIYIDASTNTLYYWNGSAYVPTGTGHDYAVVTIPASSSATLYTVSSPTANLTLKFIVSAATSGGDFASSEVLGSYKNSDNSVSHNHYSLLGDRLNYQPILAYSGSDVQLNIVNNEANPLTVSVMRVPTLPL